MKLACTRLVRFARRKGSNELRYSNEALGETSGAENLMVSDVSTSGTNKQPFPAPPFRNFPMWGKVFLFGGFGFMNRLALMDALRTANATLAQPEAKARASQRPKRVPMTNE